MTRHAPKRFLCLILACFTIPWSACLWAQSDPDEDWTGPAAKRLADIYERGEYRAKRFEGTWLDDSSGYTVREKIPGSDLFARSVYSVPDGTKTESDASQQPDSSQKKNVSPDGKWSVALRDRHLHVRDLESGESTRLTEDRGDRDVSLRQPSWSPESDRLVFIESDQSEVKLRPVLVPSDPSYPQVRNRRFARVGGKIAKLRVGVVHLPSNETTWIPLETPSEGFYLGQVEWTGRKGELLVEQLSRFRDQRTFFLVDVGTGEIRTLFTEQDAAWSVGSQEKNIGLSWVDNGRSFIVVSEKDGWRHAFLYSREGEELAVLTPGDYDLIDRGAIDEAGGWYYFYASPKNGTQKYLYRVPLDGTGTLTRITPENQPGTHAYRFSPDAKWAFHTWSAFDRPPTTNLVSLPDHRVLRELEDNRELKKKMESIIASPTEFMELAIDGDVTMDAWMIKPSDFDPSKKYPVLVYVYGEPYAQTVLDEWGTHHADYHRMIADLGFLVVSIDNRGTPAPKGSAWRRSIFGSLGPLSTEEQASGIKTLAKMRPYVDPDRVAIWGWSGGGSNTLNALFRKPDSYHVGIAVVPKPQPHLYNAWFQEIYMRNRKINRDGFQRSAPINFAEGLKGNLLIITGSGETNTHIQIVEGLVDRLIELGKPFDYMVYPNRDHGLREGRGTAVHLRMKMARYLMEHLEAGPR